MAFRSEEHEETLVSSTPVGPVAGGIMGVFILLMIAVYFYRRKMAELVLRARESNFTAGTGNDSGCRLNPGGSEDDEEIHFDDGK